MGKREPKCFDSKSYFILSSETGALVAEVSRATRVSEASLPFDAWGPLSPAGRSGGAVPVDSRALPRHPWAVGAFSRRETTGGLERSPGCRGAAIGGARRLDQLLNDLGSPQTTWPFLRRRGRMDGGSVGPPQLPGVPAPSPPLLFDQDDLVRFT